MPRDKRRKGEEKQTERIEVRLGVTLRDRFLAACKRAGDTPSDVLRAAMSSYVEEIELAERKTLRQELTMKLIRNPLKTAAMALTSLAAFAMIAAPSSADERLFNALDSNGDGKLTKTDTAPLEKVILVLDTNYSESITLDEFRTMARYGRVFLPEDAPQGISLQADRLRLLEHQSEVEYSGDVGILWSENGEGFSIGKDTGIFGTLVEIDLTELGEVRFKTKAVTLEEMSDVAGLDHLTIEMESLSLQKPKAGN